MNTRLPRVGEKNNYEFMEPYSKFTLKWNEFTCVGIRLLSDMIKNNETVWEDVYKRYGIEYDRYVEDIRNDVLIMELRTDSGTQLKVPVSFIHRCYIDQGVPYVHKVLSINLGLVPTDINVSILSDEIESLVRDTVGIRPSLDLVDVSKPSSISKEDHQTQMALWDDNRLNEPSHRAKYHQLIESNTLLVEQNRAMEKYIINCLKCSDCGKEVIPEQPPIILEETLTETIRLNNRNPKINGNNSMNPQIFRFLTGFRHSTTVYLDRYNPD